MATGAGNFEGALGGLLATHILEVHHEVLQLAQKGVAVYFERQNTVARVDETDHIEQRPHRVHRDPAHHGGLSGVQFRHNHAGDLLAPRLDGNGQCPSDDAHAAVQRQFSNEEAVGNLLFVQSPVGTQDSERHGQVEARALLANVCRSEVNGDLSGRDVVAAVFQRRAYAVTALAHGRVGQADGVEVIFGSLDAGNINLNLNDAGIDAIHRRAQSLI